MRPVSDPRFNPAYSTIKSIFLVDNQPPPLDILKLNEECVFDKIEFVENVNDVFPNGVLVVKDKKDIINRMSLFNVQQIKILFFNGDEWDLDITGISHLNNAASDTEENFVAIYFSNSYYKTVQQSSLNQKLGLKKPQVYRIDDFVQEVKTKSFSTPLGYNDPTTNYILYRPINTLESRNEAVSDNPIEYLNYLTTSTFSQDTSAPTFMFWTEFDGSVNFKSFHYDLTKDPSFSTIENDYRRFAVFEGDSVIQQISDRKYYRKIYFYNTNPAYQFISKNYYYLKKTPKLLDSVPEGLCADNGEAENYDLNCLAYQFQDEGQRFNVEMISQDGGNSAAPGADQLICPQHWGYYDGLDTVNNFSTLTNLSQNFGTDGIYSGLNFMGMSGYMKYVDNTEMWKNVFDFTTIHPNIPDGGTMSGIDTNLQKVIDIRYSAFTSGITSNLELMRKIELQNFIAYSLCCMGESDDCFFAVLQRYEVDNTKTFSGTDNYMYRYKWNKIIFDSGPTGSSGSAGSDSGSCGSCGPSGSTYYFHQLESWTFDPLRSTDTQDESWAININERGLTANYIPPGWATPLISGFRFRPIGAKALGATAENIKHIAKICKYSDGLNYFYYFIAENVVDGIC